MLSIYLVKSIQFVHALNLVLSLCPFLDFIREIFIKFLKDSEVLSLRWTYQELL